MAKDKDLSEIPSAHKRRVVKALEYYDNKYKDRNICIAKAYASGGYSMKKIGLYFLHLLCRDGGWLYPQKLIIATATHFYDIT